MKRIKQNPDKKIIGQNSDLMFEITEVHKNLKELAGNNIDILVQDFKESKNRLIIMDCEEVVFGLETHLKKLEIDTFEESNS